MRNPFARREGIQPLHDAIDGIQEALQRADETQEILRVDAVMAERFSQQRRTNGFAELIQAVLTQRAEP